MTNNENFGELLSEILAEIKALRAELEAAKFKPAQKYVLGGMSIKEWLQKYNPEISHATFLSRVRKGWSVERAAKAPKTRASAAELAAWKEQLKAEKMQK